MAIKSENLSMHDHEHYLKAESGKFQSTSERRSFFQIRAQDERRSQKTNESECKTRCFSALC